MVNKLVNSRLTDITPDPSKSLDSWLTANWGTVTGYTVPSIGSIKIDTKFGPFKGFYNYIVIEEMPKRISPQTVGAGRYVNTEVKRVQILCIGTDAKTTKWNMERHIESLINGNVTGMQATYGIDTIQLSEFNEIPTDETDSIITNLKPNRGFQKTRSSAQVTMRWESESVTI